jgi:hypothetical protein
MPARTRKIRHDEDTRSKIQAAYLINRLTDFVSGKVDLSSAQVTAALGLLKKTTPDLQSVEHSGEISTPYVIEAPASVGSLSEWASQHAPKAIQ